MQTNKRKITDNSKARGRIITRRIAKDMESMAPSPLSSSAVSVDLFLIPEENKITNNCF